MIPEHTLATLRLFPDEYRNDPRLTIRVIEDGLRFQWTLIFFVTEDDYREVSISRKAVESSRITGSLADLTGLLLQEMRKRWLVNLDCHRFRAASLRWFQKQRRKEIEELKARSAWAYEEAPIFNRRRGV